ncbi:hypothetical protein OFB94_31400, partial [Escherichia coli]|nr:hypothetical protein [Escherichia coli]
TSADVKVRRVSLVLRLSYDPPRRIWWERVEGDLRDLTGSWAFDELGARRTRAEYAMRGDPGLVLGRLLRGPVLARVRDHLVELP